MPREEGKTTPTVTRWQCGRCLAYFSGWAIYNDSLDEDITLKTGSTSKVRVCGACIEHLDRLGLITTQVKTNVIADPKET